VKTDPATTAFVAMALLRAGHTPDRGVYRDSIRRATMRLVGLVEDHPPGGPRITDIDATQLQAKRARWWIPR
jgi:hypothetical protein